MRSLPAGGLLWRDFFYRELRVSPAMSACIRASACLGVMRRVTDSALLLKPELVITSDSVRPAPVAITRAISYHSGESLRPVRGLADGDRAQKPASAAAPRAAMSSVLPIAPCGSSSA